ncbi:MAG: GatB/YqeY domain-containing protein [Chloroflexi bacterium]|nr:GatB/YqeY domain-containing protein [Chloroflexota bacterium]
MRDGDAARKSAIRMVRAAITNEELARSATAYQDLERAGKDVEGTQIRYQLTDQEILDVIRREIKQHRDSLDAFQKAGRQDLIAEEKAILATLESYLPKQMTREEIAAAALVVIEETGAKGPGDLGTVMRVLLPRIKDRADGRTVNEVVRDLLTR